MATCSKGTDTTGATANSNSINIKPSTVPTPGTVTKAETTGFDSPDAVKVETTGFGSPDAIKVETTGFDSEDATCDSCLSDPSPTPKDGDILFNTGNPDGADSNPDPTEEIGIVTEEIASTGKGQFDKYMRAGNNQLDIQYKATRIKGADYAAAFVAMMDNMMTQANGFVIEEFKARIQAEMIAAQIEEMQLDGKAKRSLMHVQIAETEMKIRLLAHQIHKTENETQLVATQEQELRADGKVDRSLKSEQADKTVAEKELINVQEKETIANGASDRSLKDEQANKTIAEKELINVQEKETIANGASDRSLKDEQANKTIAEKELINVKEKEEIANGASQRALIDEQAKKTLTEAEFTTVQRAEKIADGQIERAVKKSQSLEILAKKNLAQTQESELVRNGHSKRKLEDGQNMLTAAQCKLYDAQAEGFADRNLNDTFKTIMNAWAVQGSEMLDSPQKAVTTELDTALISSTIQKAKAKAGLV